MSITKMDAPGDLEKAAIRPRASADLADPLAPYTPMLYGPTPGGPEAPNGGRRAGNPAAAP